MAEEISIRGYRSLMKGSFLNLVAYREKKLIVIVWLFSKTMLLLVR